MMLFPSEEGLFVRIFWLIGVLAMPMGSASVNALTISAGGIHTVALKNNGAVWAWGANDRGQLGDGGSANRGSPARLGAPSGVTAVAAGERHALALKSDATLWAWGANDSGQLGDGSLTDRNSAVQASAISGATAAAAGTAHSVALVSDGTVWTWGANDSGQLGDASTTPRSTPARVGGLAGVTSIAAGGAHTVALMGDGTIRAWGDNTYGQIGDGSTANRAVPVVVSGISSVIGVAAGGAHTVALTSDGTLWAWGANASGQLGDGSTLDRSTPVQVSAISGAIAVAAGSEHTVALTQSGAVWSWGSNFWGQLGDGGAVPGGSTPIQVRGVPAAMAVGAGGFQTLAQDADGTVWTWGLGWGFSDSSMLSRNAPAQIPDPSGTGFFDLTAAETTSSVRPSTSAPAASAPSTTTGTTLPPAQIVRMRVRVDPAAAGTPQVTAIGLPSTGGAEETQYFRQGPQIGSIGRGLSSGWTLLGNSVQTAIDVAAVFGDATKVTTVWKWIATAGRWAFYTPAMSDGGAAYAASKGYDVLTGIGPGEGFWVNAKADFVAHLPGGSGVTSESLGTMSPGWNLVSIGDEKAPREFNNALSPTAPAAGDIPLNVTTLWAWNSALANWYFYAPSLDKSGGLSSYLEQKNYLDYGMQKLYPATGFWANKP